ncbi:MAG: tetratricopeptide repeat protein [Chthoniobacterales bacterium]
MKAKQIRRRATGTHRSVVIVCVILVAITWAVFGQTIRHDFVNFDDHIYVYDNPVVSSGISTGNVAWAFTHAHARNWHPLTTISHMLDCQLFGLNPGTHHFINVLLHSVAVVLLFLVLWETTASLWPSAFVAAVFAIHPLHVESVAWIAERKDVLSAVFFMLTLGAYVPYVRQPSRRRYLTVSIVFVLGLMSKPMLVTLPLILLLLDYWPLGRKQTWARLIAEKMPLFGLSAASCAVTLIIQRDNAAIDQLPFLWRLSNAIVSYVAYLGQMFWPVKLAVFYPHPNDSLSMTPVILSLILLSGITAIVIFFRRKRPYLFVGWFWYVIMLLPVTGLVQVGEQARADRYTYLPQIGLYLGFTWLIVDLVTRRQWRPQFVATAAVTIVLLLSWRASVQAAYWKNSEALWSHALAVTSNNDVAHNNLGFLFLQRGQFDAAISHFESALKIRSQNAATHYNLGLALIHNNLANALVRKRQIDEAIPHYEKAVALRPDYADAHYNFGVVLLQEGRLDEAIEHWRKTVAIQPDDIEGHATLGDALIRVGQIENAIAEYETALQLAQKTPRALPLVEKLREKIDRYRSKSPVRGQP